MLLASLDDPAAIRYRQEILRDCIAQPEPIRHLYAIVEAALQDRRGIWGFSAHSPGAILAAALRQLEVAVVHLKELRRIADAHADTVNSSGMTTLLGSLQTDLDDDYLNTIACHLELLHFRKGELMSAELARDNSTTNLVLRSAGRRQTGWRERLKRSPRSSYTFGVSPQDYAGGDILADLVDRALNPVSDAAAQSAEHIWSYFDRLHAELGFYVSCLNLREQLLAKDVPMCFPKPLPEGERCFSTVDLRPPCLALRSDAQVVGNDVNTQAMPLVMVTGANSGGKSTFLRSVGVAQLMMQCGMFVAAQTCTASLCGGVFTHFSRAEDSNMNRGRLDDELARMSVIVDQISRPCLMLFNESFSTTNEREGSSIALHVVLALLDSGVTVFFVTHQFELSRAIHERRAASTLFLRAERQQDGERSYKLVIADPLPTSFGADLYFRLGGWLDEDDSRATSPSGIPPESHRGPELQVAGCAASPAPRHGRRQEG
ncbi:MAG: MutS-related protein [Candidatus Dormibacteria bacterium]